MMRKFARFGLLSILFSVGLPAMADQYAEEIKMLRSQAVEAQFQGKPGVALDRYEQALRTAKGAYGDNSPFLAEIYYDMGSLEMGHDFDKAESFLNQAVRLNPNSSAVHLRLAELMRVKGHPADAVRHAAFVLSKHRDDLVAHQELAMAYERNDDTLRAYREYSALGQLVQQNKDIYEGRTPVKAMLPPVVLPPAKPKMEDTVSAEEAKKDAADKAAEAKKAQDAKKKAEKDASDAKKKADQDRDAKKKADAKKAQDEKKAEKKKSEQAKKKTPLPAPKKDDAEATLSGLPANLHGKAILLTPVSKKKTPATAESSSTVEIKKPAKPVAKPAPVVEEDNPDETAAEAPKKPAPAPKKAKPDEGLKAEAQVMKAPKPGKHAAGLVPPPPPVMPTYQIMPPPQMAAPAPKPKAQPKKEEKPPAAKEEKPEKSDDDDFLLDWGGAKSKKK